MKSQGQVVVVGGSRGLGRVVVDRYRSLGYVITFISQCIGHLPEELAK